MDAMPQGGFGVMGIQELIVIILILVLLLGYLGIWLWSLIHCCRNQRLTDQNRVIGIVLIVVLGIIGSLVYLFLPRIEAGQGEQNSGIAS